MFLTKRTLCKNFSYLAVLCVVILQPIDANAQELKEFGLKAGLNFSNIYGKDKEETSLKTGIIVGGFVLFGLTDRFSLVPEIYYTQKGFKSSNVDIIITLDYLEFSFLGNYKLPTDRDIKVNIFAGPAVDLKLRSRIKTTIDNVSQESTLDNVTRFDFALIVGGNFSIAAFDGKVLVEPRYTIGFISFDDTAADSELKHSVFSILIGYSF